MTKEFTAGRLDVKAFANAGAQLSGHDDLTRFERLASEVDGVVDASRVDWTAQGEWRLPALVQPGVWLQLQAEATLPLTCQRCMSAVDVHLSVNRPYRFVADEATAVVEDDASEEDVLALSPEFDLYQLIEDELLMAMPLVPRHAVCPHDSLLAAQTAARAPLPDEDAPGDKPHPFAALAALRGSKQVKS